MSLLGKTAKLARSRSFELLIGAAIVLLATVLFLEHGYTSATFESSRHGVKTFHAATGLEAIELSQQVMPDLLVLDIGLPEADGFEVVDWLRRHERLSALPVVVYTAKDLDETDPNGCGSARRPSSWQRAASPSRTSSSASWGCSPISHKTRHRRRAISGRPPMSRRFPRER